jgi:hypothetical protein
MYIVLRTGKNWFTGSCIRDTKRKLILAPRYLFLSWLRVLRQEESAVNCKVVDGVDSLYGSLSRIYMIQNILYNVGLMM